MESYRSGYMDLESDGPARRPLRYARGGLRRVANSKCLEAKIKWRAPEARACTRDTFRRDGLRPKDIAAFLAALELPQYAGGFVANGVDFLAIPALERDDWVELGVPIGHRARIVKEHKALHPEMW